MNSQPGPLRLTHEDAADAVRIELHGDFDHYSADALLDLATDVLASGGPRDLHVDCAGLAAIDSSGLSVLLMLRRHTDTAGVSLRLDNRPTVLDRMLTVTGTLGHLTGRRTSERPASSTAERRSAGSEEAIPARSSGQDTTT
ncbi:hypothetical protein SAVIM338S_07132 [Streptomyces avidinii]